MARDNTPGLHWSTNRVKADRSFAYIPGVKIDDDRLHPNCKGCEHIVVGKCKFLKSPRAQKWPCKFR